MSSQQLADILLAQWQLLWPLPPAERIKRIEEIRLDYEYSEPNVLRRKGDGDMSDQTSSILAAIESKALWLQQDASLLASFTNQLSARRNFETRAEAEIDKAEQVLTDALKTVRSARKLYNSKPVG
jgi:hypothetical protein